MPKNVSRRHCSDEDLVILISLTYVTDGGCQAGGSTLFLSFSRLVPNSRISRSLTQTSTHLLDSSGTPTFCSLLVSVISPQIFVPLNY